MSIREIFIAYSSIQKRRYNDIKMIAQMFGVKVKDEQTMIERQKELSDDELKKLEKISHDYLRNRGLRNGISNQIKG